MCSWHLEILCLACCTTKKTKMDGVRNTRKKIRRVVGVPRGVSWQTPHPKTQKRMRWWGDVMENLGNLAEKKQIKVRASMVTFFMLLSKPEQGKDDTWQSCKALEAHYIPVNANPVDGRGVYELIYHAADHLLRSNKGEFWSTMGQDVVALQTHRTNNKASRYHAWF